MFNNIPLGQAVLSPTILYERHVILEVVGHIELDIVIVLSEVRCESI